MLRSHGNAIVVVKEKDEEDDEDDGEEEGEEDEEDYVWSTCHVFGWKSVHRVYCCMKVVATVSCSGPVVNCGAFF